ncbi:N-acetyltransferase DgcN [Sphingomonas sp.]|uniref:N-acetyltransferase DgcN n=2 Tax=unclassified Sphingomonas TaxID=196159 RepID=UPI00257A145D|nr:N-acetyltransferase DgcN [Sphingomonas sp.]
MQAPYLLFLGDVGEFSAAKTAAGVNQWRGELVAAQHRLPGCAVDLGIAEMTPAEAARAGARTMIVGVVNVGGFIPEHWVATMVEALEQGLDLAAGMHQRLNDIPAIAEARDRTGRAVLDLRQPDRAFTPGSGRKRIGKRLLTVGTDCSVGKKYTALALEAGVRARNIPADFRATGQTGIMISGRGVAIDSVVADFISGAAEWLSPDAAPDHWDVIEGQGSLFHPAYAGVTLGLIHGSQPDALVVCHEPVRTHLLGFDYKVPDLRRCIDMNVAAAQLTNPEARVVGISVNTSRMEPTAIDAAIRDIETQTGLPCCDPIRHGVDRILDVLLN